MVGSIADLCCAVPTNGASFGKSANSRRKSQAGEIADTALGMRAG
jgi:hypothetical protein